MKKMSQSLRATTLRAILIVILVLVIGLSSVGFYFGYSWVKAFALEVNTAVTNAHTAQAPASSVSTKAMQETLTKEAPVIAKLATFYASPTDFQSKAIQDITNYAQKSGLAIGDVTLGGATTTTTTTTTPTTTTPSPTPTAAAGAASTASLTVKLSAPVNYNSLLKFITYVQNSLPKMQIKSLTLQHAPNSKSGIVSLDSLVIQVVTQ